MKFALITTISILFTLVSGLALPNLTPRNLVIHPELGCMIKEDFPTTPFPTDIAEVSRSNGKHNVKTLLGFVVPPCSGKCTISFTDALTATGNRRLQLFTTIGPSGNRATCGSNHSTNNHIGTFLVKIPGPADVIEDFGLTFNCPTTTTSYVYEVRPVWDDDSVTWNIKTGGFIITCPY